MFKKITNRLKRMFTRRNIIVGSFLAVPILAALISTFHVINLFALGNPNWMSGMLAVTYEIGSLSIMAALTVLKYIKKNIVWAIFFILFFMQLVGNVYFSFDYISIKLAEDPNWLNSFMELYKSVYSLYGDVDIVTEEPQRFLSHTKTVLAFLIGTPIPLISIGFTKSLIDYLDKSDAVEVENAPEIEEEAPVVETPEVENSTPEMEDFFAPVVDNVRENLQPKESILQSMTLEESEPEVEDLEPELTPEPEQKELDSETHTLKPKRKGVKGGMRVDFDE